MQRSSRPIFLSNDDVSVTPTAEQAQNQGQAEPVGSIRDQASTSHAFVNSVAEPHTENQVPTEPSVLINDQASTSHASVDPVAEPHAKNQGQAEPKVPICDQITAAHGASLSSNTVPRVPMRVPLRGRPKSIQIDQIQPGRRQKRANSARNIRIARDPGDVVEDNTTSRRSHRISMPTKPYNVGNVECFICKRSFRQDISLEYYSGNIACSFSCFLKQN